VAPEPTATFLSLGEFAPLLWPFQPQTQASAADPRSVISARWSASGTPARVDTALSRECGSTLHLSTGGNERATLMKWSDLLPWPVRNGVRSNWCGDPVWSVAVGPGAGRPAPQLELLFVFVRVGFPTQGEMTPSEELGFHGQNLNTFCPGDETPLAAAGAN